MKKHLVPLCFLFALLLIAFPASAQGDLPHAPQGSPFNTRFTYQGQIKDAAGDPITDACDFRFGLWNSLENGAQIGSDSLVSAVAVEDGYFAVLVNAAGEFGSSAFAGEPRWLEIGMRCPSGSGDYTTLSPRQILSVTPLASFAFTSAWADSTTWTGISAMPAGFADGVDNDTTYTAGNGLTLSANQFSVSFGGNGAANTAARSDHIHSSYWRINGNAQTDPATNFIGTMDDAALIFKVNNQTAMRLEPHPTSPNIIGGYQSNTVPASVYGATISGGGSSGYANQVTGNYGTVLGGQGNLAGSSASVGGGYENGATGSYSVVAGGNDNNAIAQYSTVCGGDSNTANGVRSVISGGGENAAGGEYAIIPGGYGASAPQYGQMSHASGYFDRVSDAQTSTYVLRGEYSGSNYFTLTLDDIGERLHVYSGRTMAFDIMVVGRTEAGESAAYHFQGVIENVGGATAFIGTPIETVLGEDDTAWDANVHAQFDLLDISIRGNGEVIRWVATVTTAEVAWIP